VNPLVVLAIWLLIGFISLIGIWLQEKHNGVGYRYWTTPWVGLWGIGAFVILVGTLIEAQKETLDTWTEGWKNRQRKYRLRKFIYQIGKK